MNVKMLTELVELDLSLSIPLPSNINDLLPPNLKKLNGKYINLS